MSPNLTFGKTQRLIARAEFDRVRRDGKKVRGALLTLGYLRTEGDAMRAGFVTSKKIGGAVKRNRARRRLREVARKYQHQIEPGTWLVVIAAPAAAEASYEALEAEYLRLAGRASILAPPCGG